MIHTDGTPTVAHRGSAVDRLAPKAASKADQVARSLAAARGCTIEEARASLAGATVKTVTVAVPRNAH